MFSLIVPTKGRPSSLERLLRSIDIPCEVLIYATSQIDLPKDISFINGLLNVEVFFGNETVVQASNYCATRANCNMAVICDDMEFLSGALSKAMADVKNDIVTAFKAENMPDNLPILFYGIEYYKKRDYLVFPEYKHFFCDEEEMIVAKHSGKLRIVTDYFLLRHYHPSVTKIEDETHSYKRGEKWEHDQKLFSSRVLHAKV